MLLGGSHLDKKVLKSSFTAAVYYYRCRDGITAYLYRFESPSSGVALWCVNVADRMVWAEATRSGWEKTLRCWAIKCSPFSTLKYINVTETLGNWLICYVIKNEGTNIFWPTTDRKSTVLRFYFPENHRGWKCDFPQQRKLLSCLIFDI